MTVYVCPLRGANGRLLACLMSADTPAELHNMAFSLGIQRRRRGGKEINLSDTQRAAALNAGAVEVDADIFAKMDFCRRRTRKSCTPAEARAFYAGWMVERGQRQALRAQKARQGRRVAHG